MSAKLIENVGNPINEDDERNKRLGTIIVNIQHHRLDRDYPTAAGTGPSYTLHSGIVSDAGMANNNARNYVK